MGMGYVMIMHAKPLHGGWWGGGGGVGPPKRACLDNLGLGWIEVV
jgi:hypothetical protein